MKILFITAAAAAAAAASFWLLRKRTPAPDPGDSLPVPPPAQTDDLVEKIEQNTAYQAVIQPTVEENKSGASEARKLEQECGKKQESLVPLEQLPRQKVTEITETIDSMNDVMDDNIHGQVLSSSSEVLSSHAAIGTPPASAAVIPQQPVQQQTMQETEEYRGKLAEVRTELESWVNELIEHKGKLDVACAESKLLQEKHNAARIAYEDTQRHVDDLVEKIEKKSACKAEIQTKLEKNKSDASEAHKVEQECGKKQESLAPLEQPARQKVLSSHAAISTLPASAAVIPQLPVQEQQQQTMQETEYRAKLAEVRTELEPLENELIEHKGKLDVACAESKLLKEKDVEKDVKGKTMGDLGSAKGLCTPFDQPTLAVESGLKELKASQTGSAQESSPATPPLSKKTCGSLLRKMFEDTTSLLNMLGQPLEEHAKPEVAFTTGDLGSAKILCTPFDQPTLAEGTMSAMWKPQSVEQQRHELAGKMKSQLQESKMKLSVLESAHKELAQESSLLRQMLKDPPNVLNISQQPSPVFVLAEDVNAAGRELGPPYVMVYTLNESQTRMPLEEHEAALPDDPELLIDFTSEVFKEIQERYSCSPWVSLREHNVRPGENLIQEVCNVIERHIQRPSQCTLDDITRKDLGGRSWMEVQSDIEGIVMEIGHAILEDLIEEAAFEMLV